MQLFDFYRKRVSLLCFIIAATLLFCGLVNLHSSVRSSDFEKMSGEISNLKAKKVLHHGTYVTRYDYLLTWYADGEYHYRQIREQVDKREEGKIDIWVSADNQEIRFDTSKQIAKKAYIAIAFALLLGVIGIISSDIYRKKHPETTAKRIEKLEDIQIYSILSFVFSLFGEVFVIATININHNKKQIYYGMVDLGILCGVIAVISVITFIVARNKYTISTKKQCEKNYIKRTLRKNNRKKAKI